MRRSLVIAACGAGLLAPGSAFAGGGPVPPVLGGAGVSTPGGSVNYLAIPAGRDTIVQRVSRDGGTVEGYRRVHGRYGVAGAAYDGSTTGLSADGRTLVLTAARNDPPPKTTRLLVLDADNLHVRKHVTIPGFLTLDAISPDGRMLYVLRYPKPRGNLLDYDVLAYDVRAGRLLHDPIVDPREPDEKMTGMPIARTMSPDGRWAYTLYTGEENFVHALDTQEGEARCIDLPGGDLSAQRLTLDGPTLNVGGAAAIDLRTFAVKEHEPRATPAPAHTPAPAKDEGGIPWLAVALGLAALGAVVLIARRHRRPRPPVELSLRHHVDADPAADREGEKATL
jgi:dipeptidyl aminopeptidase/acylaminoacyl peptidase